MLIETPHYEKDEVPEVEEMQCPEGEYFSCKDFFDRDELLNHYEQEHSKYSGMDKAAIEIIFEQERSRRFDR